MDLNALLSRVIEIGGSDLHLKIASPAMARIDGKLEPIDERVLSDADLEACLQLVTSRTPAKREHVYATGGLDTAYTADTVGRFLVNGRRGSISFAFRCYLPRVVPSSSAIRSRPRRSRSRSPRAMSTACRRSPRASSSLCLPGSPSPRQQRTRPRTGDFDLALEHALKETSAAERGGLRTVDTPGDGEKQTRLRLASP